ncbi:MAG: DUF4114 domain-containing protein [Bacteroides sp.]|nr:DUF4114 domain-containing protein [Bacteroides sp.]
MKRNFFFAVGLVLSLFACDNSHDNMYDPTWVREQYENQWKLHFGEIDPNQNFNMAKQVTANISIKEDALSEYTFKIYTANPLCDAGAKLLARTKVTTDAEGFAETSIAFDALVGQENFYVVRVNSYGRRLVESVLAKEGKINVEFGLDALALSRATEISDFPTMDCPYTAEDVNKLITDGYRISQGFNNMNNICDIERLTYGTGHPLHSLVLDTDFENQLFLELWGYTDVGNNKWVDSGLSVGDFKVVVADGVTWSYWKNNPNQEAKLRYVDIIVASGGVLELYSYINMGDFGRIIVMPGGKIVDKTTSTAITFNNNASTSLIYNAGTMEGIRCILQNSGKTYIDHNGILMGDKISLQNNDCVLTNWGKIDVNIIEGNGNQGTINNACLLRSDEKIQVLYLNQNANTAVECNEIYVNHVILRENSLLRSKHLDMNGSGSFIDYKGASGSSALVSALWLGVNNANTKVTGSIYVEVGEFENDADRIGLETTSKWTKVGEADFAIFPVYTGNELKESDCTGGGNIPTNNVPEQKDETQTWIVACEDLGSIGDYDFNDVVFEVSYANGDTEAYVTALAGGGTLAAYICNGANVVGEIHEMFGFDDITLMINTGVDYEWNGRNGFKGKTVKIEVPSGFAMSDNMGGFYLKVMNGDGQFENSKIGPSVGVAPQMICVPSPWRWPTETIRINEAYPLFGDWGSGYDYKGHWCLTSIEDFLY